MSQPPQNPWGQPPSDDGLGGQDPAGQQGSWQQDPAAGQGDFAQQPGQYGAPGQYDAAGQYGQAGGYGQPSANGYGQPSANGAGQPSFGQGTPAPGFGDPQNPSFTPAFGGAPQGGEPPKKGNGGKIALFVCIGCAVLAVLLVLVGGGIFLFSNSGGDDPTDPPSTSTSEPETTDPTTEPETTDPTREETTTEAPTTQAAGDGKGSPDQPYAIGDTFTLDDGAGGTVDISFGEVNWDNTQAVLDSYSGNEKPAEGSVYVTVPVTVTYHGDSSIIGGLAMYPTFVDSDGNELASSSALGPNSDGYIQELKDGDSGTFDQVFEVPKDKTGSGMVAVMSFADFSADPVYVKLG